MSKTLTFLGFLLLALIITFSIHLGVLSFLEFPLFSKQIVACYAVNFLLAAVIFIVIQQSFRKNSNVAGFIFMMASFVKFIVFFLVFYPSFQEDELMETSEFAAFFVPYAVCLIIEVVYLSKQLNNQTFSEEKHSDNTTTNP